MKRILDYFFQPNYINECIFGEVFAGREYIDDQMNIDLFKKMLASYIQTHRKLGYKFHP